MPDNLPHDFADLEPLAAAWALGTQNEREKKRMESSKEQMRELYDALLPRMDGIFTYLNQFPLNEMPPEALRLLYMTFSLAEIAPFVEFYRGRPTVPNAFDERRFVAIHGERTV